MAYLGENLINLIKQKVAKNVAISWATLFFQKIILSLQKLPSWQKIANSGHPGFD
jgi:hypothetical protein